VAERGRYAIETLLKDLMRLRAAAEQLPPERAADISAVERHLRAFVGDTVRGAAAARLLGVSHTAVARRLRAGELLRGRRPSDVDLDDLLDVAVRLQHEGRPHPLASVLGARVSESARQVAAAAGVEPARLARWLRIGTVGGPDRRELDETERRWLARNGSIVRLIDEVTRNDDAVDTVVLFGSRARGDQRLDSDVDLIVDGRIARDSRARTALRGELLERLGHDVEISTLEETRAAPVVMIEALHEGRVLKDTAGRWQATVEAKHEIEEQAAAERATYPAREHAALAALGVGS
jgi:predicted nucleotidyltransferase